MGRSGGMMDSINAILEALNISLPTWAGPFIALNLVVIFMPFILRNFKIGRARKILQRSRILQPEEQIQEGRKALTVVGEIPMGLVAIADEAIRQGRLLLAREAVQRLISTGKERDHARRLVRVLEDDGGPGSAEELTLLLERLFSAGMREKALQRLDKGLRRWPEDAGLRSWQNRLQEDERTPAEGDAGD